MYPFYWSLTSPLLAVCSNEKTKATEHCFHRFWCRYSVRCEQQHSPNHLSENVVDPMQHWSDWLTVGTGWSVMSIWNWFILINRWHNLLYSYNISVFTEGRHYLSWQMNTSPSRTPIQYQFLQREVDTTCTISTTVVTLSSSSPIHLVKNSLFALRTFFNNRHRVCMWVMIVASTEVSP